MRRSRRSRNIWRRRRESNTRSTGESPGCGKSDPTGETACPTSLQLLDLPWWGRRFRLPLGTFAELFRSLVSLGVLWGHTKNPTLTHGACIYCTACYSTPVIPFRLTFEPGISLYEQVVYAAKKAVVSGQMRPGDPFPSVRALSKALKINPNTAHKVITHLVAEGLIEVRSGVGTVVSERSASSAGERANLLKNELEQLVVEAKKLGLELSDVTEALLAHWKRLAGGKK